MRSVNSSLGERVRRRRLALGWTQQRLATEVGVSVQAISQWEADKTQPESGRLTKLAAVLETDVGHLITGYLSADEARAAHGKRVPLLGAFQLLHLARAEYPDLPDDITWIEFNGKIEAIGYALHIPNQANEPLFRRDDLVIFDTLGFFVRPGDMVIARQGSDGEDFSELSPDDIDIENFAIGRLRSRALENGEMATDIVPLNPDYATSTFTKERPGTIIGTMIEHRRARQPGRLLSAP